MVADELTRALIEETMLEIFQRATALWWTS